MKKAAIEDLEKECEGLEGKDDEQSKTNLAELVQEIENKQESLKEVRRYTIKACTCTLP